MIHPFTIFKEEQKKLGKEIRRCKVERNEAFRNGKPHSGQHWCSEADSKAWTYRHRHIAYCEIRGREREEIEKPKKGNEPSEANIDDVYNELSAAVKEYYKDREELTRVEPAIYEEIAEVG